MNTDPILLFFGLLSICMGIVFLIYFSTAARKNPYLIGFVIGKFLQGIGIAFIGLKLEIPELSNPWLASCLLTIGLSMEVFVFTSYDLIFNKRNFRLILGFCLLGILGILLSINKGDAQIVYLFNLALGFIFLIGAYILNTKPSRTRFAKVAQISFIIYGLLWFYGGINAQMEGDQFDMLSRVNPARNLLNIVTLFNFTIVSLGYTMLQKEMDEQKLKENSKVIRDDNRKLKLLNETKDQFFSIIAHDLRGPIGGLAQLGEMLAGEMKDMKAEDQSEIIQLITDTSKNSFILLENLLLWARSESGVLQIHKEVLLVKDLFDNTLHLMDASIKQKQIQVQLEVPEDLTVLADGAMLSTVFRNLISNAIKFVQANGLIKLRAYATSNKEAVCLEFEDNGVGIPENKIEDLLSLDSRFTTLGTQKESGSGLGLKLCNQFIQRHGGSLEIQSEKNKGSIFSIRIPQNISQTS